MMHWKMLAVLICVASSVRYPVLAADSCISHTTRNSLNSSQIVATNRCSKPILANICARIDGEIGTITKGERIEPGATYVFDLVNMKKSGMQYNMRECDVASSLRRDICVPQCPSERAQSFSIKCGHTNQSGEMQYTTLNVTATSRDAAVTQAQAQCKAMDSGLSKITCRFKLPNGSIVSRTAVARVNSDEEYQSACEGMADSLRR